MEHLRSCFAKLDGSGRGHLSIREIASATSLVGLRFNERELHQDLLTQDADGDGTFELHELDTVLRRNQRLQRSDLVSHTDQPFIFDVLPSRRGRLMLTRLSMQPSKARKSAKTPSRATRKRASRSAGSSTRNRSTWRVSNASPLRASSASMGDSVPITFPRQSAKRSTR